MNKKTRERIEARAALSKEAKREAAAQMDAQHSEFVSLVLRCVAGGWMTPPHRTSAALRVACAHAYAPPDFTLHRKRWHELCRRRPRARSKAWTYKRGEQIKLLVALNSWRGRPRMLSAIEDMALRLDEGTAPPVAKHWVDYEKERVR